MTPVESPVAENPVDETAAAPQPLGAGIADDPDAHPDQASIDEAEADAAEAASDAAWDAMAVEAEAQQAGPSAEVPIHRATCAHAGCAVSVVYRPTSLGHGFAILERIGVDHETGFSVSANGRPECPKGHGELTIADDLLDAHEAITQAAERQAQEAARATGSPRLPFPAPPFNHEGALHHIQEKRHEIKQLERDFEQADERRKKAKARLDEANADLGKLIDDYEERERERQFEIERRQRQAEDGHPEGTTLVRCLYERQHEGQTCPLCVAGGPTFVRGVPIAAKNSDRHPEQVAEYLDDLAIEQLVEALNDGAGISVMPGRVRDWTPEERAQVEQYLEARRTGEAGLTVPSVFKTCHLAAAVGEGSKLQSCQRCGATLLLFGDADVEADPYPAGTLVGADCPGEGEIEPHHYPTRGKKNAAAKPAPKAKQKAGKKTDKRRR